MSITSIQSILRSNLPRGPVGSAGFTGSLGFTGSQGEAGTFGGVTFDFKFSTGTDSSQDPGEGHLKFNDTNMLSATQLYIRNVDNSSTNLDSYLATIDASTSELRGHFKLSNRTRSENFVIFAITGTSTKIDDYFVVPCAFVSGDLTDSSTTFEHDDDVLITFARTGDKGDSGFVGSQGEIGYSGSLGFTGSRGETGSGLNFVGSLATDNLLPTPYAGDINDAYLVEDTGILWIWNGASWDQIGQFTGFTGSRGSPGASVRLLGSVTDISNLPSDGTSDGSTLLVPGDGFIIQSTGDLYIWSGNSWSNVGKITGDSGPIGFTGSQGIPGEFAALGYTGSSGSDGAAGAAGFTGSRGVVGYTGSRGADGTAVDIVGTAASYADLPSPYTGNVGDGYLTQDNGHLNIWMGSSWLDVGPIRGYTGSVGRLETWTKITSNYTADNNQRLIADTSGGTFTVTLPANPTLGYYLVITDGGDWSVNPLLVDGNSNDIEGQQDQVSLDITDVTVEFIWNVSTWEVTATLGVRGESGFTGSRGLSGEAAFQGYTGSEGFIGSQGDTGFIGSQGVTGFTGSQGELSIAQAIGYAVALGG